MPAADAHLTNRDTVLIIKGQFISIDEGNRTERVVIGLGMGRSDVRIAVQIYEQLRSAPPTTAPARLQLVESINTDAKSGYKPGMAESAGGAALLGHVGTGLVLGGGMAVGSEAFTANVNADTDRTVKKIVQRVKSIYDTKGWASF